MPRPRSRAAAPRRDDPPRGASALVALACFALYAALTPDVSGDKDSGEFVHVLATFGLAHPTGYPLHTLAGGAFVRALHAAGFGWAHAANLFSALGAAVAMGALHALASRLLAAAGARAWAFALLPVAALACNPVWTQEATLAEVGSWHVAWCLLAALAALRAARVLGGDGTAPGDALRAAALWGLAAGAGLAHHATSVLVSLPLTLALASVASRAGRLGFVTVAACAGAALPPLASLGWVAWRAWHPAGAHWPVLEPSAAGVWAHLTGAQYHALLGRFAPSPVQGQRLAQWVWPPLVPALVGAVLAWRAAGDPAAAVRRALGAAVVLQCGYAFLYGVSDPAPYFLPALVLGTALAAAALGGALARHAWAGGAAAALLAALAVAALPQVSVARARNDAYASLEGLLRRMWAAVPPGPGFVVWDDDMASRLRAFQQLDGLRPDLVVVQPRMLTHAEPRRRFVARHGLDPLAGIAPASAAARASAPGRGGADAELVARITAAIHALSPLPVYEFRPDVPSLRRLGAAAADSSGEPRP